MTAVEKTSPVQKWRWLIALAITAAGAIALIYWSPPGLYLWLKAFHIIAVISWMAGMLYLPRLFVYHCEAEPGSKQSETFKVMEGKLLAVIINPAMIATWVFGLWLAYESGFYREHWLQAKFLLVIVLSALHGQMVRWFRDFEQDRNTRPAKFYRIMNEVPAAIMVLIVLLVVLKPF
ncbi:MAG TPA: protoporphyrinogen oxidase HemJ [Xanthobacteraceae bacterium]|nr:protoporphyrinogen oxidase HemJ [Xanthobacteraceae bacterium]